MRLSALRIGTIVSLLALTACKKAPTTAPVAVDAGRALDVAHAVTPTVDVPVAVDVAPDAPRPRRVTVSACGEIPLTPSILNEAARHPDEGTFGWLVAPMGPLLGVRSIAFATLRGVVLNRPPPAVRDRYIGPAPIARALAFHGFDMLSLASDHALDAASTGLGEALTTFETARLPVFGACTGDEGPCPPVVAQREGIQVGFLAAATRTDRPQSSNTNDPRITQITGDGSDFVDWIRASRSSVDVLVVNLHLGREGVPSAGSPRRALVDRIVEAGADLVILVGPERLATVERRSSPRGDAVVAWSLGTLLSAHGAGWHLGVTPAAIAANPWVYDPSLRDAVVLHTSFDLSDPTHLAISGVVANAVWMTHENDSLRAVPLRGVDERVKTERLTALRAALGPAVRVRP